jgi:hypothetical protein
LLAKSFCQRERMRSNRAPVKARYVTKEAENFGKASSRHTYTIYRQAISARACKRRGR